MTTTQVNEETIAKEVKLTGSEAKRLKQLSQAERLPEDVLLRKWILEGLDRMRLRYACTLYEQGRLNLSGAARYAGVGVEHMMQELTRRGIEHSPSVEQFVDGLETLADLFDMDELHTAAAEVRRREETEGAESAHC
jgi:predicted HTH domain antitoxin